MGKNVQLLILIGAPGSGKTTFARYILRTEEDWMRICHDEIRTMQFTKNIHSNQEIMIKEMIDAAIEALLKKQCNVLLDGYHCKKEKIDHYIEKFNHLADISFKLFDVDKEILIERCEKRFQTTGKHTSIDTINKYINELSVLKRKFDFETRTKIIISPINSSYPIR